jgi:serine/threonine protein kinase
MNDDPTLPLDLGQATSSNSSPVSPSTITAKSWGPFTLLTRVGHGGFGEVFRAWDPHLEREVALKLLLATSASNHQSDREYEAMLREARALASVRHTNIVPVYGIDRHDNRVGFWTDFVRGKTLAVLLREQGPFGCHEAALIGLDLAKALSAVHRAGILHRDIKAENVMREEGGRILLMDFGLSTLPELQTNVAGTPNYMAPELFAGSPASISSDLYALGVLLFSLVAGEPPARLSGLTPAHAADAIAHRRSLMDLRPDLPESFVRAVNIAIEIDPRRRFPTAGQLAQALADCLGTSTSVEFPSLPVAPSKPSRSTRIPAAIAVIVTLVLAVGLGLQSQKLRHWLLPTAADTLALAPPNSPSIDDQYERAQDLLLRSYKNANIAAAIQGFQQVIARDPSYALAHASLGRAYLIQAGIRHDPKLLDLARTETNQALRLAPNLAPAYITLARMAAEDGHTALALQNAEKARALDPTNADAYGTLAKVFDAENRPDEAVAALEKAIDLSPDDWRFHVSLGSHLEASGRADEAAAQFQKSVALAPDNAVAYLDLGIVNSELDHLEDARNDLETSLRIEPDGDAYLDLGRVLLLEGKYDEAVSIANKAIQQTPLNANAWSVLGDAYLWRPGHRDEGIKSLQKAIALDEAARPKHPKDANLLSDLATYYADTGNPDRSLPLARQALALAPNDPGISYNAAYSYEVLGNRAAAIPLMARSIARGEYVTDLQHTPQLAALRSDPAFLAALKRERALTASKKSLDTPSKIN